jgi:hypothetical protein
MPLASWISTSYRLGIAAAIALVLSMLALQDIWHREADLRLEFWVVRISTVVIALFIGVSLWTFSLVRRRLPA